MKRVIAALLSPGVYNQYADGGQNILRKGIIPYLDILTLRLGALLMSAVYALLKSSIDENVILSPAKE